MVPAVAEIIDAVHRKDGQANEMLGELLGDSLRVLLERFLLESVDCDPSQVFELVNRMLRTLVFYLRARIFLGEHEVSLRVTLQAFHSLGRLCCVQRR